MSLVVSNNVRKIIAAPVSNSDTTISLVDTTGLPDISAPGAYTIITLIRLSDLLYEIVRVDEIDGTDLTVQRAQEGTLALSFASSDEARNFFTAGMFDQIRASIESIDPESRLLAATFEYDDTTTDADPGSGNLRANTTDFSTITEFYIDYLDSSGTDKQGLLDLGDNGLSLYIEDKGDVNNSALYAIKSSTDETGYYKLVVELISYTGVLPANGQEVSLFFSPGGAGAGGILPEDTPEVKTDNYTILAADVGKRIVLGAATTADKKFDIDVALLTDFSKTISFVNKSDYRLNIEVSNTGTMTINDLVVNKYLWKGDGVVTLSGDTATNCDIIAG